MMATCMRTLLWSFLLCFVVMTVWAMLMVEIVHPTVENMQETPLSHKKSSKSTETLEKLTKKYLKAMVFLQEPQLVARVQPKSRASQPRHLRLRVYRPRFADCGAWCLNATGSVMDANLLLFKTVVAGDSCSTARKYLEKASKRLKSNQKPAKTARNSMKTSKNDELLKFSTLLRGWGEIAVPVIRANPVTMIIFVGSLLTLVFGVLNVIVAVVVDTFADQRQKDLQNLADEMDDDVSSETWKALSASG